MVHGDATRPRERDQAGSVQDDQQTRASRYRSLDSNISNCDTEGSFATIRHVARELITERRLDVMISFSKKEEELEPENSQGLKEKEERLKEEKAHRQDNRFLWETLNAIDLADKKEVEKTLGMLERGQRFNKLELKHLRNQLLVIDGKMKEFSSSDEETGEFSQSETKEMYILRTRQQVRRSPLASCDDWLAESAFSELPALPRRNVVIGLLH